MLRTRAARFPGHETLEDFNSTHQSAADHNHFADLGNGTFLHETRNVVLLDRPGTGTTHLATGIGIKVAQAGHRMLFESADGRVARLAAAHDRGQLAAKLDRLHRHKLLICDEVG